MPWSHYQPQESLVVSEAAHGDNSSQVKIPHVHQKNPTYTWAHPRGLCNKKYTMLKGHVSHDEYSVQNCYRLLGRVRYGHINNHNKQYEDILVAVYTMFNYQLLPILVQYQQAVGGRPPRYAPTLSSLCGRRSASRCRADATLQ